MSDSIDTPQAQRTGTTGDSEQVDHGEGSLSGLKWSKPSLRSLAVLLPWPAARCRHICRVSGRCRSLPRVRRPPVWT
jgi:hypothetical protein